MEKRLTLFLACLFLSIGMAMAQTQINGTVISGNYSAILFMINSVSALT